MKQYYILQVFFLSFLMLGIHGVYGAALEKSLTDSTGDVYYQPGGGQDIQTGIASQPDIDISLVSYETDDDTLTLKITVVGEIAESEQILYYGECESSDAVYQFTYKNNDLQVFVETDAGKLPVDSEVDVVDNTLFVMIPLQTTDATMSDLYAYAHFYEDAVELMMGPKYVDTTADIDNDSVPSDGSSSSNGPGTPGFDIILFLAACVVVGIIIQKRR